MKTSVLSFLALLVGYAGGLYAMQRCSLKIVADTEEIQSEIRASVIESEYFYVQTENFMALRYITMLQHMDSNESKKMKRYLVGLLADSYRRAKLLSQKSYLDPYERKSMDLLIDKIDSLSNKSEVFREIRESGSRDS